MGKIFVYYRKAKTSDTFARVQERRAVTVCQATCGLIYMLTTTVQVRILRTREVK